jgi:photosystem II stability/assembly factor-like uncharacterized protein
VIYHKIRTFDKEEQIGLKMKQQKERKAELKACAVLVLLLGLGSACTQPTKAKLTDDIGNDNETPTSKTVPAVIYRSTDAGKTWGPYTTGIPPEATVSSFLSLGNTTYATTDTHGIYTIKEGDSRWKRIDADLPDKVDINAVTSIDNVFIIGTHKHGILISSNNGINWEPSSSPISHTAIRSLLSYNSSVFAGADDGIYKSLDQGNTWQHVYKGVQTNGFTVLNSKIYAALMNGAIVTPDEGASWKYIYQPHTLHDISSDGESVYAMTLGGGLLKSSNDGLTWENINEGFGGTRWYTFEVKNIDHQLFAAQWYGIYSSDKRGSKWQIIRNGLPDSTAFSTLEVAAGSLMAGIGLRKD